MIRRLIILTFIQFSLLLSQTQIAIVDFEGLGVSSDEARALTNRLMIEMHRTNKFIVLEREMLDKIIEEQKFQLSGCNSDVCLVELGQIANVQQIVGGTISKVGEIFTITARLISVETGEVMSSALYDSEGKIGGLMKTGMERIASQIASQPVTISRRQGDNETSTPNINSSEPVIDIDGNKYKTVKIGNQIWMAENLRATHYQNGDAITKVTTESAWRGTFSEAYCNYNFDDAKASTYGRLYNWYAVMDSRSICPEGWHIPSDNEWKELEIFLGLSASEADETEWRGIDGGLELMTSTGFYSKPAGYRYYNYGFSKIDNESYFWSSSDYLIQLAVYRRLDSSQSSIYRYFENQRSGLSVRCVKD